MEENMSYMPVVIEAHYLSEYKIRVIFDNGQIRVVDCKKWLKGPLFQPLLKMEVFKRFFVDGWTVSWPNGADIAPETLYETSV